MKKKYYWLIGIAIILIITNPSMSDFKAFKGTKATESEDKDIYDLSRTANFLIFSIYDDGFTRAYLGIGKNFIPIGNSHFETYNDKPDSTKMADSAKAVTIDTLPKLPKGFTAIDTTELGLPVLRAKVSVDSFAHVLKRKYPAYNKIDNNILVKKFIAKYPNYKDSIK